MMMNNMVSWSGSDMMREWCWMYERWRLVYWQRPDTMMEMVGGCWRLGMVEASRMVDQSRLGVCQAMVEWRRWRSVYQGSSLVVGRRWRWRSCMVSLDMVWVRSHLPCRLTVVASSSLLSLQYFPR